MLFGGFLSKRSSCLSKISNDLIFVDFEQTTGSLYFWAAHLAGPKWGPFASWCCAWLEAIGLIAGIGTQVDSVVCLLIVLFPVALLLRSIYQSLVQWIDPTSGSGRHMQDHKPFRASYYCALAQTKMAATLHRSGCSYACTWVLLSYGHSSTHSHLK